MYICLFKVFPFKVQYSILQPACQKAFASADCAQRDRLIVNTVSQSAEQTLFDGRAEYIHREYVI